jgi:hypothetical protein
LEFLNPSGGVPMHSWGEQLIMKIANTPGHARRYEAMLMLNGLARHRPLFESALSDTDPRIRSAAYTSLAIRGGLKQVARLAKGLDDPEAEVRGDVIGLILETLIGSEIDAKEPFFIRSWEKVQQSAVRALREDLIRRLKHCTLTESGEAQTKATLALRIAQQMPPKP